MKLHAPIYSGPRDLQLSLTRIGVGLSVLMRKRLEGVYGIATRTERRLPGPH
jgi:hypothetical protein